MKNCIACGMPMNKPSDFAAGDPTKDYCVHCANPDGSMHSFEQKKENLTEFIVTTQGLDHEVAQKAALSMMRKLPAWQGYFTK